MSELTSQKMQQQERCQQQSNGEWCHILHTRFLLEKVSLTFTTTSIAPEQLATRWGGGMSTSFESLHHNPF